MTVEKFFFPLEVPCFLAHPEHAGNFIARASCSGEETLYLPTASQDATHA